MVFQIGFSLAIIFIFVAATAIAERLNFQTEKKMDNKIAGYWIDGAERKPEPKHCDIQPCVIAKWKNNGEFDLCLLKFRKWDEVYWLDTTQPEVEQKPDPGEGWRLLHPDEDLEFGDQIYIYNGTRFDGWQTVEVGNNKQTPGCVFRRNIQPRYEPYRWEDREELRGRWYREKGKKKETSIYWCDLFGTSDFTMNGWSAKDFLQSCEWIDGSPCGRRVE